MRQQTITVKRLGSDVKGTNPEVKRLKGPPRSRVMERPPDFYLVYHVFPRIRLILWPSSSSSNANHLHAHHLERDHLLRPPCVYTVFLSARTWAAAASSVWNVGYCCFVLWSVLTSTLSWLGVSAVCLSAQGGPKLDVQDIILGRGRNKSGLIVMQGNEQISSQLWKFCSHGKTQSVLIHWLDC